MSENIRGETQIEHLRFPCEQMEYAKTVGWLLPTILEEIFGILGFEVQVNPQQANGVDLEVFLEDDLVLVVEVLNWSIRSRLTNRRKSNIIANLDEFNCNKLLICTVPLSNLDGIEENGIHILEIGYQVLPVSYYDFFLRRGQVERRRIDSESTRRDIRAAIQNYIDNHLSERST